MVVHDGNSGWCAGGIGREGEIVVTCIGGLKPYLCRIIDYGLKYYWEKGFIGFKVDTMMV